VANLKKRLPNVESNLIPLQLVRNVEPNSAKCEKLGGSNEHEEHWRRPWFKKRTGLLCDFSVV